MASMYFSGKNSNEIFYDDPDNRCIHIYKSLFIELLDDEEQNARVYLDTAFENQRFKRTQGITCSKTYN